MGGQIRHDSACVCARACVCVCGACVCVWCINRVLSFTNYYAYIHTEVRTYVHTVIIGAYPLHVHVQYAAYTT